MPHTTTYLRTDHNSSAFWVDSQELSWNDAPAATLPKGFLVDLLKDVFGWMVFQDDNTATVTSNNNVIYKIQTKKHILCYFPLQFYSLVFCSRSANCSWSCLSWSVHPWVRTFSSSSESEGHQGPNNAKDLHCEQCVHLSRVGIWSQQFQDLPPGNNNLLHLGSYQDKSISSQHSACHKSKFVCHK